MDTLAEEEGLPYTAACTLFDSDTDLWHTGSWEPLSQRGAVNQGRFVGFRSSKELHVYNGAWNQPPCSPRRQHHLDFPQQLASSSLNNNRMNGLKTAEGMKSTTPDSERPFLDSTVPMCRIHSEMMNSTLKSPLHCSPNTDDSFTKILKNDPTETLRKCLKMFQTRKEKGSQLKFN